MRASLEQLLITLIDAETGERGFVITGVASYLDPYERARAQLPVEFAAVRALVAEQPEQEADLD